MEKLKKIFIYMIILSSLTVGVYAKGTLKVTTTIIPEGKTKKYNYKETLLLDAGVMNSNSDINKIKIATIVVDMRTEKSGDDDGQPAGITGDFNLPFKLKNLEKLGKQKLAASNLKKYKNGNSAIMDIYTENIKILDKKISNEKLEDDNYLFIAYPEEVPNINNKVERLKYSFDLILEVSGVKTGDIIRKDIEVKSNEDAAIGRIKDIIKDQFLELQK